MTEHTKTSPIQQLAILAKMLDDNDAVVTVSMKAMDDDSILTEVTLHEFLNLPDGSNALKSMYYTALGALIAETMERYPVENVLGFIKSFVEEEIEGKGQSRH